MPDQSFAQISNISVGDQQRLESLQMIIREKDREIASFISTIHVLKKDNNKFKNKDGLKEEMRTLEDIMQKLNTS